MPARSTPRSLAAAAATATALAAPALAHAAPLQVEQVNRAAGVAGAFALQPFQPRGRAEYVTNSGRYGVFEQVPAGIPGSPNEPGALPNGLYVRDLVVDHTYAIAVGDDVRFAGEDAGEHTVAFTTARRLDPADTNDARDLYASTNLGRPVLLSRADGKGGAATGITNGATLSRDGGSAVFETTAGIMRRDLATGTTTRIGAGTFVGERNAEFGTLPGTAPDNFYASADGRVVGTTTAIVTPTRSIPVTDADGTPPYAGPFVSSDGGRALVQGSLFGLDSVRLVDTTTGRVTTPTVPAELRQAPPLTGYDGRVVRLQADGRTVVVDKLDFDSQTFEQTDRLVAWNLETGAVKDLGLGSALLAPNLRYGITSAGGNAGAIVIAAAAGRTLPGTVDLPSPNAYAALYDACAGPERQVSVGVEFRENLPVAKTLRIQALDATGRQVLDRTLPVPTSLGYDPSLLVELPVGDGAYRLRITATFADGRSRTEWGAHRASTCAAAG